MTKDPDRSAFIIRAVILIAILIGIVTYFALFYVAAPKNLITVEGTIQGITYYDPAALSSCRWTEIDLGEDGIWAFDGHLSGLIVGNEYRFFYDADSRKSGACGGHIKLDHIEVVE